MEFLIISCNRFLIFCVTSKRVTIRVSSSSVAVKVLLLLYSACIATPWFLRIHNEQLRHHAVLLSNMQLRYVSIVNGSTVKIPNMLTSEVQEPLSRMNGTLPA